MDRAAAAVGESPRAPEPWRITQIWTGLPSGDLVTLAGSLPSEKGRPCNICEDAVARGRSLFERHRVAGRRLSVPIHRWGGVTTSSSRNRASRLRWRRSLRLDLSSRVQRTTGGYDGTYAVRAMNNETASGDVGFRESPSQASSTVAGRTYNLSVWVAPRWRGRTINLKAREVTSSGGSPGARRSRTWRRTRRGPASP